MDGLERRIRTSKSIRDVSISGLSVRGSPQQIAEALKDVLR